MSRNGWQELVFALRAQADRVAADGRVEEAAALRRHERNVSRAQSALARSCAKDRVRAAQRRAQAR